MSLSTDSFARNASLTAGTAPDPDSIDRLAGDTANVLRYILDTLRVHAPNNIRTEARILAATPDAVERFKALEDRASPSLKSAFLEINEGTAGSLALHMLYDFSAKRWQVLKERAYFPETACIGPVTEAILLMQSQTTALCHVLGIDPDRGDSAAPDLTALIRHVRDHADNLGVRLITAAQAVGPAGEDAFENARTRVRTRTLGIDCVVM